MTDTSPVVVSYGMGTDSAALLFRWIYGPATRPLRPAGPAGGHRQARPANGKPQVTPAAEFSALRHR